MCCDIIGCSARGFSKRGWLVKGRGLASTRGANLRRFSVFVSAGVKGLFKESPSVIWPARGPQGDPPEDALQA